MLSTTYCLSKFNSLQIATKSLIKLLDLHKIIYWYYSSDVSVSRSMGFAPNSIIIQDNADIVDKWNN
jgi:hypothetical protein